MNKTYTEVFTVCATDCDAHKRMRPAALFVAYTRVAAEKHYFTDVLIGAAIGSAIGLLVPWLHKNNNKSSSETLSPQTLSLRLSGNILTMSGVF